MVILRWIADTRSRRTRPSRPSHSELSRWPVSRRASWGCLRGRVEREPKQMAAQNSKERRERKSAEPKWISDLPDSSSNDEQEEEELRIIMIWVFL